MTRAARQVMSFNDGVRLESLLQSVPALLQGLPSATLHTLLQTFSNIRCAVQHHITVLRIPACDPCAEDPDIQLLVKGARTGLQRLVLYCTSLQVVSVTQLRCGAWPHLKHLNVGNNSLGADAIKQLVLGDWPKLEELVLRNTRRDVTPSVQHPFQQQLAETQILGAFQHGAEV